MEGPFLVELKENYDMKNYSVEDREKNETLLWSYRAAPTLDLLHQRITGRTPVLQHCFKVELFRWSAFFQFLEF